MKTSRPLRLYFPSIKIKISMVIIFFVVSLLILLVMVGWIYEGPKRLILRETFRRNSRL